MKKTMFLSACVLCLAFIGFSSVGLASMLGITTAAATKVINVIDTASNIAMIVSLVATIIGAGAISTALIATAKSYIKKYGKKYAAAW